VSAVAKLGSRNIEKEVEENAKKEKAQRIEKILPDTCSLVFPRNPLEKYVTLPSGLEGLKFSNIICGAIRGAMEVVGLVLQD
jgi:hypothetical protein